LFLNNYAAKVKKKSVSPKEIDKIFLFPLFNVCTIAEFAAFHLTSRRLGEVGAQPHTIRIVTAG
jgi:hypothetical protein